MKREFHSHAASLPQGQPVVRGVGCEARSPVAVMTEEQIPADAVCEEYMDAESMEEYSTLYRRNLTLRFWFDGRRRAF